jgi:aspartate kinase
MALIVQKFGGTSVADTQRIRNVANRTLKTHEQGNDVVVILSAMAGVTDHLIGLANAATSTPDRRELDVLLATGEQTTAALLAMMLKGMGVKAQSLLGHQAEVVTDCEYGNARILEIGTKRIKRLLADRTLWWWPVFRALTSKETSPPWVVVDRTPRPWPSQPP